MSSDPPAASGVPARPRTRCAWTPEERAEWVRLLEQSGQGLSEFCRANGLHESTVSLWRKQLREPASEDGNRDGFIEVPLPTAPAIAASDASVTLRLPGGVSLAVPVGTDPTWLADLIRQLRTKA